MEYEKNPDGTDKLDEQGNPIPVRNADIEAEKIRAPLVGEIKDLREKLQFANAALELTKTPETPPAPVTEADKIADVVRAVLNEEKSSNAQANKKAALEKFIADNREFNPDVDTLGLKREALEKKLAQFNTDKMVSVDDFYAVIGDAKTLLGNNDSHQQTPTEQTPYSNIPTPRSAPQGKPDAELSAKEMKLMTSTGRTKEQILALKAKNPEFFQSLIDYIPD